MFASLILSKIRTYMKYRDTVRQLSQLTDRELEDIGVTRYQIRNLAKAA